MLQILEDAYPSKLPLEQIAMLLNGGEYDYAFIMQRGMEKNDDGQWMQTLGEDDKDIIIDDDFVLKPAEYLPWPSSRQHTVRCR